MCVCVCVCVCVCAYVCKYDINVVMLFSYGNSTIEIKIEMLRIPHNAKLIESPLGLSLLCQHNLEHNRVAKALSIMPA